MPEVRLRPVRPDDLPALFEIQTDSESNDMAGTKPRTREAFFAAWNQHLQDPAINGRVIELHNPLDPNAPAEVVGSISCFQPPDGANHVGYWIARAHWGKGIASRALTLFLAEEPRRPLHATTARNNSASQRILERCGFRCTGVKQGEETDRYLKREVAEWLLA